MGTTFVTIRKGNTGDEPGFWMRDEMLEIWLRLLALHLPEPTDQGEHSATLEIRNRWLLASRFYFGGCTPHDMERACSNPEGRSVVRYAIDSLMNALRKSDSKLDADTVNLLGIEGCKFVDLDRDYLLDIGYAFTDLLEDRIVETACSTEIMPGSKPYARDRNRVEQPGPVARPQSSKNRACDFYRTRQVVCSGQRLASQKTMPQIHADTWPSVSCGGKLFAAADVSYNDSCERRLAVRAGQPNRISIRSTRAGGYVCEVDRFPPAT